MSNSNNSNDDLALPPANEIDWDAVMRDFSPPEWDLMLSASAKNDLEGVRDFIENQGVPVTHSNGIGQTALHVAVLWGHVHVVRYLLSAGANANAANQLTGATPLHVALHSHKLTPEQQVCLVNLLLDNPKNEEHEFSGPSDPTVEDKFGKCPAEYMDVTHPHWALLMKRIAPPPPGVDRLRANFLKTAIRGVPTCGVAAPKARTSKEA